jgi:hypothetical protein
MFRGKKIPILQINSHLFYAKDYAYLNIPRKGIYNTVELDATRLIFHIAAYNKGLKKFTLKASKESTN